MHLVRHFLHGRKEWLLRLVRGGRGARMQHVPEEAGWARGEGKGGGEERRGGSGREQRVPSGLHAKVAVLDALVTMQHRPRELGAMQRDAAGNLPRAGGRPGLVHRRRQPGLVRRLVTATLALGWTLG